MCPKSHKINVLSGFLLLVVGMFAMGAASAWAQVLPLPFPIASTVPSNGDLNTYGVVFVPAQITPGLALHPNDLLVTNFNDANNLQGRGTTILHIDANGQPSVFFQNQPPVTGMTAAIAVAKAGWVFAGNLPTIDGTPATALCGGVSIMNGNGGLFGYFSDQNYVCAPWGMALIDGGTTAHLFVSNVMSGTITRFDLALSPTSVRS